MVGDRYLYLYIHTRRLVTKHHAPRLMVVHMAKDGKKELALNGILKIPLSDSWNLCTAVL